MRTPRLETLTASVKATALFSELLLGTHVVTAALPRDIVSMEATSGFTAPIELDPAALVNLNVSGPQQLRLHEVEDEWSRKMEKRFEQLSIGEALSTLAPREQSELEKLSQERRRLHHPRNAEEILFEYRQRQITSNLIKAVQEYVRFHDIPHQARTTPN